MEINFSYFFFISIFHFNFLFQIFFFKKLIWNLFFILYYQNNNNNKKQSIMANQVPFQSITLNNIYIYLRNKCIIDANGDNREEIEESVADWIDQWWSESDLYNTNFYINNFPIKNNINEIKQELLDYDDLLVEFEEDTDRELVEVILSCCVSIMEYDFNVEKIVDDIMEARCEAA